ncbi:MAG: acyl-CoA synthetase [Saprospiraceae bacterium]|nr:acyl-CoA synthetase [Saprospiraceae bacterium]
MKFFDLFNRASRTQDRTAVVSGGRAYTYRELLDASGSIASAIEKRATPGTMCIAYLVESSFDYVATQWAIWRLEMMAVPLCDLHPAAAISHVLSDSTSGIVITQRKHLTKIEDASVDLDIQICLLEEMKEIPGKVQKKGISLDANAMMLYTSGTTNRPKGVVTTFANLEAQLNALSQAWHWQASDYILNVLPLHHVHGIVNVLTTALWNGACCHMLAKFDAQVVWELFKEGRINVFMAVPTIYHKLTFRWQEMEASEQLACSAALNKFRLMVSGSAALPVPVLQSWQKISGHVLLERYGMTEIGMALSNPYHGERRPGFVGLPLPGVQLRLVQDGIVIEDEGHSGEIQIKGLSVFKEYWMKPKATEDAFTDEGWFKTGDIAVRHDQYYRILGRSSVDIIKSGGYKISALEIESIMQDHEMVSECAVVGLPDEEWGQVVAAAIVSREEEVALDQLREWLRQRLAPYQNPRKFLFMTALPKNTLGKVTKKALVTHHHNNPTQWTS